MSDGLASSCDVITDKSSRYMQQMCKHFAHKLDVNFDKVMGSVSFPFGLLKMEAKPAVLTMTVTAQDDESLVRLEGVAERHLQRFMFREEPEMTWSRG